MIAYYEQKCGPNVEASRLASRGVVSRLALEPSAPVYSWIPRVSNEEQARTHWAPCTWPPSTIRVPVTRAASGLERRGEGVDAYQAQLVRCSSAVAELFAQSEDLRQFGGDLLAGHPGLIEATRFLAAPPVSADDLDSLTGYSVSKRMHVGAEPAGAAASVLRAMFDSAPVTMVGRRPAGQRRGAPNGDCVDCGALGSGAAAHLSAHGC